MQLFAGARVSALHTAGRFNLLPASVPIPEQTYKFPFEQLNSGQ